MLAYEDMRYHPIVYKLANILCKKTQNTDPQFFRILVSYYLTKCASMMRCNVKALGRGSVPVNMYAINLVTSGHGKGYSTNIMEEEVINEFKSVFIDETYATISERNLAKIANKKSLLRGTDPDDELEALTKTFQGYGPIPFSFDSGTTAALKQMRLMLLTAGAGSLNMEIDEIGSNLLGQVDILTAFLELFDIGKIKQKLLKNTADNKRSEDIDGRTPANMMLFGTPNRLLNGGKEEAEMESFFDTGYARRCIFGYSKKTEKNLDMTVDEIYDMLRDTTSDTYIQKISQQLGALANIINFNKSLLMNEKEAKLVIEYRKKCEAIAATFTSNDEIRKAEMDHRYFKALKLAGTYAWVDGASHVTEDHIYNAIKLVEDSGKAFSGILSRERPYMKLARYIAEMNTDLTHPDIAEDLAFYKGTDANKKEMMKNAQAWGYTNNIIIKKTYIDGIEFLRGESLEDTNLDEIILSYSTHIATGYKNETVPFDKLHKLVQAPGYHWVAHHLAKERRNEENCMPGVNLIVIDVDDGTPISTAEILLKNWKYMIYTTKRHTKKKNRYRIIFPMTHILKLTAKDYKEFMNNFYNWLPFEVDRQTNQRSRKWLSHKDKFIYHDGELVDSLLFVPKTSKAEAIRKTLSKQQDLSSLERWVINTSEDKGRNNQLLKYAFALVDIGLNIEDINDKLLSLNNKLPNKLSASEILSTISVSTSRKIHERDTK